MRLILILLLFSTPCFGAEYTLTLYWPSPREGSTLKGYRVYQSNESMQYDESKIIARPDITETSFVKILNVEDGEDKTFYFFVMPVGIYTTGFNPEASNEIVIRIDRQKPEKVRNLELWRQTDT